MGQIPGLVLPALVQRLQQVFAAVQEQRIAAAHIGLARGGPNIGAVDALNAQHLDAFVGKAQLHEIAARGPVVRFHGDFQDGEPLGEVEQSVIVAHVKSRKGAQRPANQPKESAVNPLACGENPQ